MYDALCSWENLRLAYRSASRGKRGNPNVAVFEYRLEDNLCGLREDLVSGRYHPGPYTSFFIHEPKRRLISAAPFRDRVVHHALCNVLEPIFEPTFIAHSYANRVGKGTHRALDRVQRLARRLPFVLQCDIKQFFPGIDHDVLRDRIARKVTDVRILGLVDVILTSGVGVLDEEYDTVFFPGDDLLSVLRPRGLPIGNLTSQFWANVFMSSFDHFVTRELRAPGYVRYVDDFLLFGENKTTLWTWRDALVKRLAAMRLTIHGGAQAKPVTEGIPFLGFVVWPSRRRLKRRKGIHYARKLRTLTDDYHAGRHRIDAVNASVRGWVNYVRYANSVGLRKAVLRGATLRPCERAAAVKATRQTRGGLNVNRLRIGARTIAGARVRSDGGP